MNTQKIKINSDMIPQELKELTQWVVYRLVWNKERKKYDKIPYQINRNKARTNDPRTWATFNDALKAAETSEFDGIGFVFSKDDPYCGIDFDHSVNEEGEIKAEVDRWIKYLNSYTEYSPSGEGIHTIVKTKLPGGGRKWGDYECYDQGRFFTVTGNHLTNTPFKIEARYEEIKKFHAEIFGEEKPAAPISEPIKEVSLSDQELLDKAFSAKNGDKFRSLWDGDISDYPSQSEADLALCNKLAFWTTKDTKFIDRLFRQSGLMRPKWDEEHFSDGRTYGQSVIEKAISGCSDVYGGVSEQEKKANPTQGERITRDCEENIKDFFRDQHGNTIVVLPIENHLEVCPTSSTHFRNWIATRYRQKYSSPPNTDAINQARVQIEARCVGSRQVELFNRVGWYKNAIYYDLTTQKWCGVRIDENGWEVVPLPPIFRRYQHQAEQVIPVKDGDPKEILRFCNVSPDDHCLFIVAIASFFIPNIPHVILNQTGEQGSGKSNNSRKIKGLVDPSRVMLISTPKDLEQAQMTAEKHWISTFDNISKIPEWFSDFLCRGVTGEGDMKRSLYTNDEEFIRAYRRCFVLNGIGASMSRGDLIDRAVIFDAPVLKNTLPEKTMDDEWQKALPGILGGFFTAVSKAMSIIPQVNGHQKFRMADFAQWGAALAGAMGFSQDEFFKKYQDSIDRKWQDTAEESALVGKIDDLVELNNGEWSGSVSTLLGILNPESNRDKHLPSTPRGLSSGLIRIAPVLRKIGIDIIRKDREGKTLREPGKGRSVLILRKIKMGMNVGVNICEYGEDCCEQDGPSTV